MSSFFSFFFRAQPLLFVVVSSCLMPRALSLWEKIGLLSGRGRPVAVQAVAVFIKMEPRPRGGLLTPSGDVGARLEKLCRFLDFLPPSTPPGRNA
jgi:hypothetical protein